MAPALFEIMHNACPRRDINPLAKIVLLSIADRVGQNGESWPGFERLAIDTGSSVRGVIRAVKALEQVGLIQVKRTTGRPNHYRLSVSPVPGSHPCQDGITPVPGSHRTRARMAPLPVPGSHPNLLREPSKNLPMNSPKEKPADSWVLAQEGMIASTLKTEAFESVWRQWDRDRRERGKKLTAGAIAKQIRELEEMGHDRAMQSIEQSIKNGWTGLFEPKNGQLSPGATSHQGGQHRAAARVREYPVDATPLPTLG